MKIMCILSKCVSRSNVLGFECIGNLCLIWSETFASLRESSVAQLPERLRRREDSIRVPEGKPRCFCANNTGPLHNYLNPMRWEVIERACHFIDFRECLLFCSVTGREWRYSADTTRWWGPVAHSGAKSIVLYLAQLVGSCLTSS